MATSTFQGNIGPTTVALQPGEKTVLKRNGIAERTSIYISRFNTFGLYQPGYTPYPEQNTGGFVLDSSTCEALPGGFFKTTNVWVSIWSAAVQYITFDAKLIQVPIDQSPNFATQIGGTPGNALNGAIFDANGRFVGFPADSAYAGVVSCYITQSMRILRGASSQPYYGDGGPGLIESLSLTLRGAVWEYEITYNLSINAFGIPQNAI